MSTSSTPFTEHIHQSAPLVQWCMKNVKRPHSAPDPSLKVPLMRSPSAPDKTRAFIDHCTNGAGGAVLLASGSFALSKSGPVVAVSVGLVRLERVFPSKKLSGRAIHSWIVACKRKYHFENEVRCQNGS